MPDVIDVRPASPEDWETVRTLRLAALVDAPNAFAAAYDAEAALTQAQWCERLTAGRTVTAWLGVEPVGLVVGFVDQSDSGTVELVAMWVAPASRCRGVGEVLLRAVETWACEAGARRLHLWVTESNLAARRLYERCGFLATDEHQPLPSAPELAEIGMERSV